MTADFIWICPSRYRSRINMWKKIDSRCPCIECSKRNAECHSRCSAYSDWRKVIDEEKRLYSEYKSQEVFFTAPRSHRWVW